MSFIRRNTRSRFFSFFVAASSPMTLERVLKDIEEAVILESESENLPED